MVLGFPPVYGGYLSFIRPRSSLFGAVASRSLTWPNWSRGGLLLRGDLRGTQCPENQSSSSSVLHTEFGFDAFLPPQSIFPWPRRFVFRNDLASFEVCNWSVCRTWPPSHQSCIVPRHYIPCNRYSSTQLFSPLQPKRIIISASTKYR